MHTKFFNENSIRFCEFNLNKVVIERNVSFFISLHAYDHAYVNDSRLFAFSSPHHRCKLSHVLALHIIFLSRQNGGGKRWKLNDYSMHCNLMYFVYNFPIRSENCLDLEFLIRHCLLSEYVGLCMCDEL